MSKTLIVAEIQKDAVREATLELVSLARKLGGDIVSLVIGSGAQAHADSLAKQGGGKVLLADAPSLESYTGDGWANAIQSAVRAETPDLILISNTPSGWDVAAGVGGLGR